MTVLTLVAAALLVIPVTMSADLGEYLEGSEHAEYRGEVLVSCDTPDGSRDAVFEIAQTDGSVAAWSSGSDDASMRMVTGTVVTAAGETVETSTVSAAGPLDGADEYVLGAESSVEYLGRPATEVVVRRDGSERIRLVVDDATGAVLRSTTYAGDGGVYCDRRLLSFEEGPGDVAPIEPGAVEPTEPLDGPPAGVPTEVAGFGLADTYPVEEGTLSYYSDGFFSFGIVVTDRPIGFGAAAEVATVTANGGEYRRSYEAGRVTVTWRASGDSMALIGDLPPDLTDAVLDGMPAPDPPGFFDRIWETLFG